MATRTEPHPDGQFPPYRLNVAICLFNAQGKVWVGERCDTPGAWQMPQGGLDEDDTDFWEAAKRELHEEIGCNHAFQIGEIAGLLHYDFPDALMKQGIFKGKYRGQAQKWLAARFTGTDSDIVLDRHDEVEFSRWQWVDLAETLSLIVPFKRDIYQRVIAEFSPLAQQIQQQG